MTKLAHYFLVSAASDLNTVLGLDPKIDTEADDDALIQNIKDASALLAAADILQPDTDDVLVELGVSPKIKRHKPKIKRTTEKPKKQPKERTPRYTRNTALYESLSALGSGVDVKLLIADSAARYAAKTDAAANEKEASWSTGQFLSVLEAVGAVKRESGTIVFGSFVPGEGHEPMGVTVPIEEPKAPAKKKTDDADDQKSEKAPEKKPAPKAKK